MEHKFQFTRHLLSCNNIGEGKLFSKDFEPSASLDGIYKTILFSINNNAYEFDKIYVSNLIRTWITATLMYGANSKKILTLYISPYLKETHMMLIQRGNYPKKITKAIPKFLYFLKVLHQICTTPIEEIDNQESFGEVKKKWYEKLANKLIICTPHNEDIIFKKKGSSEFVLESDVAKMQDSVGPTTSEKGFLETGNLKTFMDWINSPDNYYGKKLDKKGIIHVVTHSNVMRDYLETKGYIITSKNPIKSNIWRFITTPNKTSISENEIILGVPQKIPEAKELEGVFRKKYNTSLCGVKGSVKNNVSGGRKTRRKNSVRH